MSKFIFSTLCSIAFFGVITVAVPASAKAAEHGQHNAGGIHNSNIPKSTVHAPQRTSARPPKNHVQNGQLSYNAYWKAATSPFPPNTNGNQNIATQKLQAWKDYQDRIKK
jgi:hypothetical protein